MLFFTRSKGKTCCLSQLFSGFFRKEPKAVSVSAGAICYLLVVVLAGTPGSNRYQGYQVFVIRRTYDLKNEVVVDIKFASTRRNE